MNQTHKEYLRLNKNLLLGFAFSATISAFIAQLLVDQENYLNTTFTIIAGYVVFFLVFGILFYYDIKKRYLFKSSKTCKVLTKEIIKLVSSLGVGEAVYITIRWLSQYYLLGINYEPYVASFTSEVISTILYLIVVTLSVRLTGLFKDYNQISSSS